MQVAVAQTAEGDEARPRCSGLNDRRQVAHEGRKPVEQYRHVKLVRQAVGRDRARRLGSLYGDAAIWRCRAPTSVKFELMTPSLDRRFEVARLTLQPGGESMRETQGHPGEEALLILSGSVRFELGNEMHVLFPGDVLMWDARTPHRVVAFGDGPVTGLMVISPPTF